MSAIYGNYYIVSYIFRLCQLISFSLLKHLQPESSEIPFHESCWCPACHWLLIVLSLPVHRPRMEQDELENGIAGILPPEDISDAFLRGVIQRQVYTAVLASCIQEQTAVAGGKQWHETGTLDDFLPVCWVKPFPRPHRAPSWEGETCTRLSQMDLSLVPAPAYLLRECGERVEFLSVLFLWSENGDNSAYFTDSM